MDTRVERQVERILEMSGEERHSVIVRVASPDDKKDVLIDAAASAIQRRNLTLTARDVLPASREVLQAPKSRKRSAQARKRIQEADESLASKIAASAVEPASWETLKASGQNFLDPLINSEVMQNVVAEAADRPGTAAYDVVQTFWTSKSALINNISSADLRRLAVAVPEIRDIHPNRVLRVPRLVQSRNLPATVEENRASAWGVERINALAVWGAYGARGQGVTVGVLDTGVDAEHPDLKGKVVAWAEFDAEGNEVAGSQAHDSDQHGTHCAGTIAGGNASGRWIGVAPEAKLAVALVLDGAKGGTDAQVLAGIDWLVEQGVDVISMSLGGLTLDPETPRTYTEAILTCLRAGIPVVTAIGNEGSQTTGSPGNDLFAFAVGATDHRDLAAGFSGGRTQIIRSSSFIPPEHLPLPYSKPDVCAPGVAVLSSIPGGKWEAFNGTSMATPHVAGAVALLLSATSIKAAVPANERAFVLQDLLVGSVDELGEAGQDHRYGFGRIDVLRAIGFARDRGFTPPDS